MTPLPFGSNVLLPDGEETLPGIPPASESRRLANIVATRRRHYGDRTDLHVLHLGCRDGSMAAELARLGYGVTGIEARSGNMACCQYLQSRLGLSRLNFIQGDVKTMALPEADVIVCFGLLYHLDYPRTFLLKLAVNAARLLLVHSHYALPERANPLYPAQGALCFHDGLLGRWVREYYGPFTPEAVADNPSSAFSNDRSFWLTRASLLCAMYAAGYHRVAEHFDYHRDMEAAMAYIARHDRSLFVGAKDQ